MPDEKFDEKEMEKRDEKMHEKSAEEKWQRDPLGSLIFACIVIWAGLVLLATNLNLINFRSIAGLPDTFNPGPWSVIMIGAGLIILVEIVIRLTMPAYRRPIFGSLIIAIILIGSGLGNLTNWNLTGALILIVIGVSIVVRGMRRSQGS